MKFYRVLATIVMGTSLCLIGYQSAFAQGMSPGAGNSPPTTSSVEGRTYCFEQDALLMRSTGLTAGGGGPRGGGPPRLLPARIQSQIIRRTATFSGGVFTGEFLSRTGNTQIADTGDVTQTTGGGEYDPSHGNLCTDWKQVSYRLYLRQREHSYGHLVRKPRR